MWHVVEEPISVRIVQGPVFAERLPVIPALHSVQHREPADVRAVEQVAEPVEVEAPGVPAALAKQLELPGERMVSPDALLELNSADVGRNSASLAAVQPTVGAPCQRV